MEMKTLIAIGIIFLFLGVAIAPSINITVVKASNDKDLVEVTSQACGIQGFGNTTVKLTNEQYQNLEQYLVEFRERLNQTTTREEAVPLFKEAVVELNKFGLLPKGFSEREAERLVLGAYEHPWSPRVLGRVQSPSRDVEDSWCLVTGLARRTSSMGSLPLTVLLGSLGLFELASWCELMHVGYHYGQIYMTLFWLFLFLGVESLALGVMLALVSHMIPIAGFEMVSFGGFQSNGYWAYPVPASGWLNTIGTNGKENWSGEFYGNLTLSSDWRVEDAVEIFIPFPGIVGFTGFQIHSLFNGDYYIGHAVKVKIKMV
jgi:hypothetical protein